ncbi:MAG: prohibitin family protein [Candidatus Omnitrophica bacterium]|nr:prohibitin family protein [Candidatus Omnitrophota bacterium]
MWILVLGLVGLVAGLALILGLERQYARPILVFAILGLAVGVGVGSIRIVPAGHVGVVDLFGTVSPNALKSGLNLVNPLAKVVTMSIRTQEDKETMSVPSKEGLTIELEISALFHLAPDKAVEVYKTVGPQYAEVLFVPQFRAAARGVTGGSEAKALYTSEREVLGKTIFEHLQMLVQERGIAVENILLRKVALPPTVRDAIERKLRAEQEFEQMKFVNQREEMEAERKRIEARGVRDSQAIIAETLSPQYLNYLWIRNLAENQNVIYVATEANMPIFRSVEPRGSAPSEQKRTP